MRSFTLPPKDLEASRLKTSLTRCVSPGLVTPSLIWLSGETLLTLPTAVKDDLHHWCVSLTNNKTLGRVAMDLGLEKGIIIGKSLKLNLEAKDKHKVLAGALEGVFGAIHLDGGIGKARTIIRAVLKDDFERLLEHVEGNGE